MGDHHGKPRRLDGRSRRALFHRAGASSRHATSRRLRRLSRGEPRGSPAPHDAKRHVPSTSPNRLSKNGHPRIVDPRARSDRSKAGSRMPSLHPRVHRERSSRARLTPCPCFGRASSCVAPAELPRTERASVARAGEASRRRSALIGTTEPGLRTLASRPFGGTTSRAGVFGPRRDRSSEPLTPPVARALSFRSSPGREPRFLRRVNDVGPSCSKRLSSTSAISPVVAFAATGVDFARHLRRSRSWPRFGFRARLPSATRSRESSKRQRLSVTPERRYPFRLEGGGVERARRSPCDRFSIREHRTADPRTSSRRSLAFHGGRASTESAFRAGGRDESRLRGSEPSRRFRVRGGSASEDVVIPQSDRSRRRARTRRHDRKLVYPGHGTGEHLLSQNTKTGRGSRDLTSSALIWRPRRRVGTTRRGWWRATSSFRGLRAPRLASRSPGLSSPVGARRPEDLGAGPRPRRRDPIP